MYISLKRLEWNVSHRQLSVKLKLCNLILEDTVQFYFLLLVHAYTEH